MLQTDQPLDISAIVQDHRRRPGRGHRHTAEVVMIAAEIPDLVRDCVADLVNRRHRRLCARRGTDWNSFYCPRQST
ncbi:hypothetical protein [Mycobacterium sp. URHB0021]